MRKYTRIGTLLLALVMCLTMLTAQAESELPEEVADLFTVKAWAHYAIANQPDMPENEAFAVMQEESGYEAALLVMRNTKSETNVLVLAEKSSAQADWKITMRNWGAVGQGDANVPQLAVLADGRFVIHYPNGDSAYFTHEINGWQLTNLSFGDTIQVEVSRSGMTFLTLADNGKWVKTTVSGVVETAMAQFSMDRFPRTVAAAREHLTNPPTIPDSPWSWTYPYGFPQPSQYAKLAAGKQYAVYSAPLDTSFRAANGKALLSTNDWVQVFFEEDGYLLVQYAISRHQYRIGYIKADAGVEFVGSGGNRQLGELPGAGSSHIGAHRRPAEFLRRGDDADGGAAGDVSGAAGAGMGVCGDDDGTGAADSRLRGIERAERHAPRRCG